MIKLYAILMLTFGFLLICGGVAGCSFHQEGNSTAYGWCFFVGILLAGYSKEILEKQYPKSSETPELFEEQV